MAQMDLSTLYNRALEAQSRQQQIQQRGQAFEQDMQAARLQQREAEMGQAAREAQFFVSAMGEVGDDPEALQQGWSMARQALARAGGDVNGLSDVYNPQQFRQIQGLAKIAGRMPGQSDAPAAVREYEYFSSLPENEQLQYLQVRRGGEWRDLGGEYMNMVTGERVAKTLAPTETLEYKGDAARIVADAQRMADEAADQRGNDRALAVYNRAMGMLSSSLAGTDTGPFMGRIPAVTTSQQVAEGAVAAMAPILKSMFRTAGEGTFTDNDQKLLMDMVPTRTDTPEAAQAKIEMINTIVMAKLGTAGQQSPGQGGGNQGGLSPEDQAELEALRRGQQ